MLPAFVAALLLSTIFTALTRNFAVRKSLVDSAKSVRKVYSKKARTRDAKKAAARDSAQAASRP